jgi:hypothetical protein
VLDLTQRMSESTATRLSARQIAAHLAAIEGALDLRDPDWQEGDVHWWPLYRTEAYRLLFVAGTDPAGTSTTPALAPLLQPLRWETPRTPIGAVWLVGDGAPYARLGARTIERFCGPLHAALARQRVPAVVIDRAGEPHDHCYEPTRWWAPLTLRTKVAAKLRAHASPDARHARLVAQVTRAALATGLALHGMSARRMQAMATAVDALARKLERRMRREQVRAVFVVAFYDVSGYAYVLAAARAGVPSVDLQHGVTSQYSVPYVGWPALAMRWQLLPQWFWTWTDADAQLVDQWAASTVHRTVCGGHPLLEAWRDGTLALDAAMDERLAALRLGCAGRRALLVTFQPRLVNADALAPLLWAMQHCQDVFWWLRLHPIGLTDRPILEALLTQRQIPHYEIDCATALPLPAVLQHAQLHLTHSSSSFIEAAALGIASIVWSRYGAELAEAAIASGSAQFADDGPTLQALIERAGTARPAPARQLAGSRAALKQILESTS